MSFASLPLFAALPPDELARLTGTLREVTLDAGALLFHEGDEGHSCFIVLDGEIGILRAMERGERLLAVQTTGQLFGEGSLLYPDHRRTAGARAHIRPAPGDHPSGLRGAPGAPSVLRLRTAAPDELPASRGERRDDQRFAEEEPPVDARLRRAAGGAVAADRKGEAGARAPDGARDAGAEPAAPHAEPAGLLLRRAPGAGATRQRRCLRQGSARRLLRGPDPQPAARRGCIHRPRIGPPARHPARAGVRGAYQYASARRDTTNLHRWRDRSDGCPWLAVRRDAAARDRRSATAIAAGALRPPTRHDSRLPWRCAAGRRRDAGGGAGE